VKRNGSCLIALLLLAAGCGGGEDASSGGTPSAPTPPGTSPPATIPPPSTPTPAVNHPPVIQQLPPEQHELVGHAFSFDLSMGGTTVKDADLDPLAYTVRVLFCTGTVLQLADGLTLSGTQLSGVPVNDGYCDLQVDVTDSKPGTTWVSYPVKVWIAANSAPVLAHPNAPQLVGATGSVDYDPTQAGTTFVDPDGDAMTYEVSLRGDQQGLMISGARIVGTFPTVGAVDVTVTARDGYGGSASQSFLIAKPASASTEPHLHATRYLYQDEELALPYVFRTSSESVLPLWDTQPVDNPTTDAGATLGRVLFYDRRLSLTNTISCASCHDQSHGFASPQRFDVGITGIPMKRNSMALANARYNIQSAWFWDMRAEGTHAKNSLQDVVLHPLQAHDELGMSPDFLVAKLAGTSFYPQLFADAFGSSGITIDRVGQALGQFVQALISYRAKADQALNPMNDVPAVPGNVFNAQELSGMDIFNLRCSLCHEPQAHANVWQANNGLDVVSSDPGTLVPAFQRNGSRGVFRTPSLRNIAVSAPYMHDGRFATLREVIEHYNSGVQPSGDLDAILRNVDGTPRRLDLTEADKNALEAFLRTLTDQPFLSDAKFSDPFQ